MYLRRCYRRKDGKRHAYWALVESYRTTRGPRQRVVAWLGVMDERGRLGVKRCAEKNTAYQTGLFTRTEPDWVEVDVKRGARGTQPEIRRPLAGKRVAAPVGTGSLLGREATERTRGDSLVSDGHDFDSRSAV